MGAKHADGLVDRSDAPDADTTESSAIDLGKAVSAMVTQPVAASVRDYLEGIGTGRQLVEAPLPLLAMPTTGGTGAPFTGAVTP